MITFDDVTLSYAPDQQPVVTDAHFVINEGELVLAIGPTGSGKSTLLKSINGLMPHFTGGLVRGRICVDGLSTADHQPRDLAETVGMVLQNPMHGFVADTVEEEMAYGMECLAIPPHVMRRRVEEILDLLGLDEVRNRPLLHLSAGQKQRVAIGAALAAHPRILILDEPTSALDPGAAEEVLAALHRLVHDLSMTVVMAEHRLERVLQYADRVLNVPGNGEPPRLTDPATAMVHSAIAPPIIELGRAERWSPLPLTVREARVQARGLRERFDHERPVLSATHAEGSAVAHLRGLTAGYGSRAAVRELSLEAHAGEVIALMGRNGAGKSTLLHCLAGLTSPLSGEVRINDENPTSWKPTQLIRRVGFVPANPSDLLESTSVEKECAATDNQLGLTPRTTAGLLHAWAPEIELSTHPHDLSEGQRLLLALAIVLAAEPPILILDEPTRGLDYPTKAVLTQYLRDRAALGTCVIVATHDVELAAELSDRVLVMAQGEIVTDGATRQVLTESPMFAPQIAKVMAPIPCIRVSDVLDSGVIA